MKTKHLFLILTALLLPLASQAEEKPSPSAATGNPTTDTFELKLQPFTPDNDFSSKEWFHWGGSIIRESEDSYLLCYSRWPRKYGFLSWLTHSEIAIAHAKTPSGPWTYQYTALKGRRGNHWDAVTACNPKIKKFGSKYYIYYIATTQVDLTEEELIQTAKTGYKHKNWRSLRNAQRVGVAVSNSPKGPWKRQDKPLIDPAAPAYTLSVNPAITERADGKGYIMMFKGDKKPTRSQRVQAIATAPTPTGPFTILPDLAIKGYDTEDAGIWHDTPRSRYYAVVHAHAVLAFITSEDGIHWEKAKNSSLPKVLARKNASAFRPNRLERPDVYLGAKGTPEVFISCYRKGNDSGILTIPVEAATTDK